MILLSKKMTNERFYLNHRLIERIECREDTVIMLTSGKCYMVSETPEQVRERIIEYENKNSKGG
ncbi:flagellar FlbD family protein (plasmid) [Pontibacillus sp. ALD_SL1]|uniref:flagellar FlbD family protein n=1 Tax=Pontibacillus sp. ALD_SL1 TaxID=2777185 RepID=UPI001A961EA1|nr:flagellar FlbD family protein [Pontibacillus sp. ALD_SL1]QST03040.1 flagellar FlbD family protein [Pontibacillus sp. ALD_SL1]